MFDVTVYRDCDERFRLRKVVVSLRQGSMLVDRTRMFAGPLFKWRLSRRIRKMQLRAVVMTLTGRTIATVQSPTK